MNTYFNKIINDYERKISFEIRHYGNKTLKEIGYKIVDLQEVLLIEKFTTLEKYLQIFDEIIENIANARTKEGINVFKDYFKSEYKNLLIDFKNEYIKKHKMLTYEIEINEFDKVSTLYKKLNSIKSE